MARPKGPNRKRVQVTLSQEAWKLVAECSDLVGQSRSSLIAELLDSALPALQVVIEAHRTIKDQPREVQRLVANFGSEATRDLAQAQLDLDAAIDKRTVKGKRSARGARATS